MLLIAVLVIGRENLDRWVGHYFAGTATGENHTFELKGDGAGKYVFDGCFSGDQKPCRWSFENDRIVMTLRDIMHDSIATDPAGRYLPVHWGPDRFLLSEPRILEFTEAVRRGWRGGKAGHFPVLFIRRLAARNVGNSSERLTGEPQLPATYAPLLHKPFVATLSGTKGT